MATKRQSIRTPADVAHHFATMLADLPLVTEGHKRAFAAKQMRRVGVEFAREIVAKPAAYARGDLLAAIHLLLGVLPADLRRASPRSKTKKPAGKK
jgi:hypothetical protein